MKRSLKNKANKWEYSDYRATLSYDGDIFAIITPDGVNAMSKVKADLLVKKLNGLDRLAKAVIGHFGIDKADLLMSYREAEKRYGTEFATLVKILKDVAVQASS